MRDQWKQSEGPGAFAIRIRLAADLEAKRFDPLAWAGSPEPRYVPRPHLVLPVRCFGRWPARAVAPTGPAIEVRFRFSGWGIRKAADGVKVDGRTDFSRVR